jgi:hypothetical protein
MSFEICHPPVVRNDYRSLCLLDTKPGEYDDEIFVRYDVAQGEVLIMLTSYDEQIDFKVPKEMFREYLQDLLEMIA